MHQCNDMGPVRTRSPHSSKVLKQCNHQFAVHFIYSSSSVNCHNITLVCAIDEWQLQITPACVLTYFQTYSSLHSTCCKLTSLINFAPIPYFQNYFNGEVNALQTIQLFLRRLSVIYSLRTVLYSNALTNNQDDVTASWWGKKRSFNDGWSLVILAVVVFPDSLDVTDDFN